MNMMNNGELHWTPRVSMRKIQRLYTSDAQGLLDADLVDDVGYGFYARLLDMFEIDEASRGRITCRRCQAMILRKKQAHSPNGRIFRGKGKADEETLICPHCHWEIRWSIYFESYSGKNLLPNSARDAFEHYLSKWPRLKTAKEKLLLIDWLLHQFHLQYTDRIPVRPAAVNLIEGTSEQIITLLHELAYGPDSTALLDVKQKWINQLHDTYRQIITTVGTTKILKIGKELGIRDYRKTPIKHLIDRIQEIDTTVLQAGQKSLHKEGD